MRPVNSADHSYPLRWTPLRGIVDGGSIETRRWSRASNALVACAAVLLLFSSAACEDDASHSCDNGDYRCADPDRPYCDLEGEFPESMGVSGVCIPNPFGDAGVDAADRGGVEPARLVRNLLRTPHGDPNTPVQGMRR